MGRRWKNLLWWIGVPSLLLAGCEIAFRVIEKHSYSRSAWYEGVSDRMSQGPVDFLFIGTSRTAVGLDTGAFEDEWRKQTGQDVVCVNLGRGFSGAAAHYFGLRELIRRHPESMRHCTVSIEMSTGLLPFHDTWKDDWYFPGNAQLVVDYMRWDDLVRFLGVEGAFDAQAGIVARYLLRSSALVAGRRTVQQTIEWRGQRALRAILARVGAAARTNAHSTLPASRQLRQDAGGVKLQRDLIVDNTSAEALAAQTPRPPCDEQILCQASLMLRGNGGPVAFHEVLVPSYVWRVNDTEVRRNDRREFTAWSDSLGLPIISVPMAVNDDDFPDLSHLRRERVGEYSRSLARAMVASDRLASERKP
ncbi:MAG: hypothetical protein KC729_00250 [Candidatus Eisenbacteria bacterium]|uniref:Uncharacterized protein n=1 Tax=Eiseniibacteriota bacterium TaxID=2212470 RepID=A0A956LXY7_UNCEI|nr:hypothetical protein [Candidatus Eisenbacteria bacterium]